MKILIVKTSSLGDIIHAFPTLKLLNAIYPHAEIDWIAESPAVPLLQAQQGIRTVHCIDTKAWRKQWWRGLRALWTSLKSIRRERYDWVIDLQGNAKSSLFTWFARGTIKLGYGFRSAPEWIHPLFVNRRVNPPAGQNIRQDYLAIVRQGMGITAEPEENLLPILPTSGVDLAGLPRPLILVCPGSAWPNKQLLPDTLAELLQRITPAYFLLLWNSSTELAIAETLQSAVPDRSCLLPRLELPALQALMSEVDEVIAMDSLPLHLAATVGTATFAVFGPSSAAKYAPVGPQHVAHQGSCPYNVVFDKRCPQLRTCGTGACIRGLSAEELSNTRSVSRVSVNSVTSSSRSSISDRVNQRTPPVSS